MQKKSNTKKRTVKNTAKKTAKKRSTPAKKNSSGVGKYIVAQVMPYLLIVLAILIVVCFFTGSGDDPGVVNGFVYKMLTGFFSGSAFAVPVFLIIASFLTICDKEDSMSFWRYAFGAAAMCSISALLELISPLGTFNVIEMFNRGCTLRGGGVIGGLIGEACLAGFKSAGSYVIVIALLLLSLMLTFGLTPKYIYQYFAYKRQLRREEMAALDAEEMLKNAPPIHFKDPAKIPETVQAKPKKARRPKFDVDVPAPEEDAAPAAVAPTEEVDTEELNISLYNEVIERSRSTRSAEELEAEKAFFDGAPKSKKKKVKIESLEGDSDVVSEEGAAILDRAADSYMEKSADASITAEREDIGELTQVEIEIPKPEYVFPPRDLLSVGEAQTGEDIRSELHENAARLVKVLASFNVKTKIIGVSRGPTITRYELLPEAGTRVRSIANLVDDIALNLATSGVRIEAPIPGKAAVGIEVPNKSSETVYLRSLLDTSDFSDSKSKITTALGKNVGGETVIMDIKKMPHLLIAGATGMGKSVCINCLIVSLLYKATPDEVKLILIDPKKVEFSVYNGLPHLLVPVVSDPKKAAGSLNWAVNEMERRFSLIEAVGVRDIASYNEITKNDPDKEYMPQIVIIIDELADLMSTAPDDVETSIARLAAKARAAGMHLVIGTQRPSVDVITGVIKANIPSRIAFTVASQVDSRTIIDRSGAESLIGRGDMLYNPVGAAKPMRVQGAFVSESEVDSVVSFIKEHNSGQGEINNEVMKEIEAQAAMCGVKKGSGGGAPVSADGAGEDDPLLRGALEVAFESGKISTSLLQRRLSIGYGRAAKIIDRLEQLHYVSAPEGQKPRELLITRQQYMEKTMRESDEESENQ